jgi:glycosyltransferase involved in cell wall biosynthesis
MDKIITATFSKPSEDGIFIVIPAYNESAIITSVIDPILKIYKNVVVVDDGSKDGTSLLLKSSRVFLLRHIINRGQGAALQTGIQFSLLQGADIIVTFDADGQHNESDIRSLIEPILKGECDVTLGSRFLGQAHGIPISRRYVLRIGILFTRIVSHIRISDIHNGLRAFSRQAARSLCISMDRMAHASEILDQIQKSGWRYKEVPVNVYYSRYSLTKGQSSWSALKIALQVLTKKIIL